MLRHDAIPSCHVGRAVVQVSDRGDKSPLRKQLSMVYRTGLLVKARQKSIILNGVRPKELALSRHVAPRLPKPVSPVEPQRISDE